MIRRRTIGLSLLAFVGCADLGDDPPSAPDTGSGPSTLDVALDEIVPARTVVGDEVILRGMRFGDAPGAREVEFETADGVAPATVVAWADDAVSVEVPAGAASGSVLMREGDAVSPAVPFDVAPRVVSFTDDLVPLFDTYGCTSCHTGVGSGGFVLGSRDEILAGDSDHGPVVTPRRGAESVLIRKLRGTAGFGAQMPFGSDPLPDEEILIIQDWIDQGVRDN